MPAKLRRIGSTEFKSGHVIAECDSPECADGNGAPWMHMFPTSTVEGYDLAKRDMDEHNRARHEEAKP